MAKALFGGLDRIQLMTFVGFAGVGGVFAAGMGKIFINHLQDKVIKNQYYTKSLDLLNRNRQAIELIGKPIKINKIDLSDQESNNFGSNHVKFKIPLSGNKLAGDLCVDASRISETDWEVNSLKFRSNERTFVIYRSDSKKI